MKTAYELLSKQDKRRLGGLVAKIERHKNAIANHRDQLREIYDDLESILESTDTGVQNLNDAVAVLSEYV